MIVLVFGATGLIGSECFKEIDKDPNFKAVAIVRSRDKFKKIVPIHLHNNVFVYDPKAQIENSLAKLMEEVLSTHPGNEDVGIVNLARNINLMNVSENFSSYFADEIESCHGILEEGLRSFGSRLRRVVLCSSIYGQNVPNPTLYENGLAESPMQYGIAKVGVEKLCKEYAVRLKQLGCSVNVVSYGGVRGRVSDEFELKYKALNGFSDMLDVRQCIGPIKFLLSHDSSGITGHVLNVDNGYGLV